MALSSACTSLGTPEWRESSRVAGYRATPTRRLTSGRRTPPRAAWSHLMRAQRVVSSDQPPLIELGVQNPA
jgi:hypothetical protein